MGSRKTHDGAERVYAAAQRWVDCALRADDSLFTPGKAIWSSGWLEKLRRRFLDQPDKKPGNFMDKLHRQLEGSPPEVYQLIGEALYVHYLIISESAMGSERKKRPINMVLEWSAQDTTIPLDLVAGLAPGIAHPEEDFLNFYTYQVGFLIEFVEQWKAQQASECDRMLADPSAFEDFLMSMPVTSSLLTSYSNRVLPQRQALLHLVFPDTFEAIVSVDDTESIAEYPTHPTDDVDRQLNPWDEFVKRAQAYVSTGRLERDEISYKLEIGHKVAAARKAVLNNDDGWAVLVKRGISSNLIHRISLAQFSDWLDESPNDTLRALQGIWTEDTASVAQRIRTFCSSPFHKSAVSGTGTRLNIISVLLMGLDAERYPPFRTTVFKDAYARTGYDRPVQSADEAALYEHSLGFLDRFIEEANKRGLTLRHRLDAQSVVWGVMGDFWEIQNDDDGSSETEDPTQTDPGLPTLAAKLHLTPEFLREIKTLLYEKKQVIFQGPPGTGKTYVAQALAEHLAGSEDRVTLVQLHPSYAYEDFVQGFRPTLEDRQPGFQLKDGPLLRAAERAESEPNAKHFLVIDEINRGNPAKVFGELYFLLEYRDDKIHLQYSDKPFSLPKNLYFIGTMNTADRSIALVDLALRRRFYFVEFHPDDEPVKGVLRRWLEANAPGMDWLANVVERTNEKMQDDRHAAIGPSYFMKDGLDDDAVKRIWKHSVLPYIEERRYGEGDLSGFGLKELRTEVRRVGGENDEAQEQGEPGATNEGSGAQ